MGDRGIRGRGVAGRRRAVRRSTAWRSDAGSPFRGRFGHEAGAPLAHFEDVVIAPRGITRIDDFVVRRLRLDLHGEAVAFATYAFDLNHVLDPRGEPLARTMCGGTRSAGEKPWSRRARAFHGGRDAVRQPHRPARMRLEHEAQRTPLPIERREQLCAAIG